MAMEQYDLDDEKLTNDELVGRLAAEYDRALREQDETRIAEEIAPRFWARFGPYFNEYEIEWNSPDPMEEADSYMLDEGNLGKVQMDWMDQVLKGEIEIGEESDEEPSEA
jgi:hypothetical protein